MKTIRLIWVGKSKEPFVLGGIEKYLKLLKPYADIETVEVKEARGTDSRMARQEEGTRILEKARAYILLDESGEEMTSLEFAGFLREMIEGRVPRDLVVGGPFGVSEAVRKGAVKQVALSRLTFTHQMVRLVLMEQIFRAFTILKGRPYHY